jgi:ABC-type multidrug transport system ATPase subunit
MNEGVPLTVDGLTVKFSQTVFSDVSLEIRPKEFITIMGENGSGKSILVETLMGYHRPNRGSVFFWGRKYSGATRADLNRRIGWVLSRREDYPIGLTVNRFFQLLRASYHTWDESFARDLVEKFCLDSNKQLSTLSLGEQSKVKLIKALAFRPELVILDELTANLSPESKQSIIDALVSQFCEGKLAILNISHSKEEAFRLSDCVYHLTCDGLVSR